jgi:hypothetical protein
MNAIPHGAPAHQDPEQWVDPVSEPEFLPARPRRHLWGPATAVLLAALVGAGCFYAGVRVEKSHVGSSSAATGASALVARLAALRGATAGARTGAGAGAGAGATGAPGGGLGLGRFGGAGANGTFGTVSAVSSHTLYLTDTSANTIEVTLSSATTITKSETVSSHSVRPGDTVAVQGLKASDGTISATTVSDTGTRAGAGGSGSGSGPGSTSSSSALNSLFGSGG